ncbi:islet cell autoantigen 1-like protein [Bombina bombina]|uniref:islet cell autoantigen 1-like protein n=1 Tax=Bombina bombina TaxID=8345 RepID=UPI00235ADBAE|nr:islet cell autoantigen 1-like protein [Bombina bombina]
MDNSDQQWAKEAQSMVSRMQKKFWKTKQVLIKVTRQKEDEHVVASDAELDAKLEIFQSIQMTGSELLKMIEKYQQSLNALSEEENDLGLLLKIQSEQDNTEAGKMLSATGNALCFSAGLRFALCTPLVRLEQEMATFSRRAVSDTLITVNQMEKARTEYRGALLWMKDVSQELDPDTYKQMEKFRKVQLQVRNSKTQFDMMKMNVCQKVDLLGASRCNLLSHSLATYQTTLLQFWKKTAQLMAEIQAEFQEMLPYSPSVSQPSEQAHGERNGTTDMDKLIAIKDDIGAQKEGETASKDLLLDSTVGDDFAQEFSFLSLHTPVLSDFSWDEQNLYGDAVSRPTSEVYDKTSLESENLAGFLPSQLLDLGLHGGWSFSGVPPGDTWLERQQGASTNSPLQPTSDQKTGNKNISAWLNLFADLDPLSNIGSVTQAHDDNFSA